MHLYPKRALLEGFETEIFKLLFFGATPDQWAEWLRAPLEHAAARGNLDLVTRLLKAGANGGAGWRGCRGRTLLDAAALGGNPDVVVALLKAGWRPDAKVVSASSKRSALHLAVVCGHKEVARKLILSGANVKYTDPADRCTPLHVAAGGGHEDIVTDLLISGASPRRRADDESGHTPLHNAAAMGQATVASVLLENAARVDALSLDSACSALMLASENGHVSTAKILLAAGADGNKRNEESLSALDSAAAKGYIGVVKAILDHGADVTARDACGWTALHWSALCNHEAIVDVLLDAGADVNADAPLSEGWTPLHAGAQGSSTEALVALLRRGADVNKITGPGSTTALHRACYFRKTGVETIVDLLLRWGASETAVDSHGLTAADMLEKSSPDPCPAAEVEGVRVLLARAPADRAWRRRCWLVMLRSRGEKERLARSGSNRGSGLSEGGRSSNKVRRGDADDLGGSAGYEGSGGGGAESLSSWVTALVELESEGLFRAIVGFL